MASGSTLKKRTHSMPVPLPDFGAGIREDAVDDHPAGDVRHGNAIQLLRFLLFASYFWASCFTYFQPLSFALKLF